MSVRSIHIKYLVPLFLGLFSCLGGWGQTVEMSLDTVSTMSNGTAEVIMAIRAKSFNSTNNVGLFSATIQFPATNLTYLSVENIYLPSAGNLLVGYPGGYSDRITLTWVTNGAPAIIADGDPMVELRFQVNAAMGATAALSFVDVPTKTEMGDINNNPILPLITNPGQVKREALTIVGDTITGPAGGQATLPFRVRDYFNMVSGQGTVAWNAAKLSYVSTSQYGSAFMDAFSFGVANIGAGELSFSYSGATPESLNDEDILFSVTFNVLGTTGDQIPVTVIDGVVNPGADIEFVQEDPLNSSNTFTVSVISLQGMIEVGTPPAANISVDVSLFLEGPYQGSGLMSTWLTGLSFIPLTDPYSGTETTTLAELTTAGEEVVDWVLLELRSAIDPTVILSSAPVLLKKNGETMAPGGTSPTFDVTTAGSYYLAVKHRNHLGVMTASPVAMSSTPVLIDFTSLATPVFGFEPRKIVSGTPVLWGGDGDTNGAIQNQDNLSVWTPQAGQSGYLNGDFDLNGFVQNSELLSIWVSNVGRLAQLP